jgi:hypothetical protein
MHRSKLRVQNAPYSITSSARSSVRCWMVRPISRATVYPVPGGAAFELLQFAYGDRFDLVLSDPILTEVADVLLTRKHLRDRYRYTDQAVATYVNALLVGDPTKPLTARIGVVGRTIDAPPDETRE